MWRIQGKIYIRQCWKKYIFLAVILLVQCVSFRSGALSYGNIMQQKIELHIGDYIAEFFKGTIPYAASGKEEPFNIPGIWSLYYIYFFILIGKTFSRQSDKFEQQMLLRNVTRAAWWRGKNFEILLETAGYQVASVIAFFLYGVCTGAKIGGSNAELLRGYGGLLLDEASGDEIILHTFLPSFFVMLALAYIQVVVSLKGSAITGIIISITILAASVFARHPLLLGNYMMLIRQKPTDSSGVETTAGILVCLVIILLMAWIGNRIIKKKDLF